MFVHSRGEGDREEVRLTAPLCQRSDDCGKRNVLYGVQFRSVDCVSGRVCTCIPNIDTFDEY